MWCARWTATISTRSSRWAPISTAGIFPVIEKWLARPVLPINIATVWHALRSCGIDDRYDQMGRLFEEH